MLDKLFKNLDAETVTLLTRFAMRGVKSGNLNEYIKGHLRRVMEEEDNPRPEPPRVTVTTKAVPR